MEQVRRAITAHAMDPDRGQFAPKPADIVRVLQGTQTDRSLTAWGKVYEAMQRVGAYRSVAFDDGAIHAAIEDIGGWCAICRLDTKELPHLQRRFTESYRVHSKQLGSFAAYLPGEHEIANRVSGHKTQAPVLIGDESKAMEVMRIGGSSGGLRMTPLQMAQRLVTA